MAYLNLVKTVLIGGSDKYEIYAVGVNGEAERIIHYKLRSNKNSNGVDGKSEAQWFINDPLFPLPKEHGDRMVANIGYYLDENS
ncbi:hypothetical protein [Hafnia alvei]|uniref:hypothetical protein n=1 Tax=Hafnia alvei TaxID=569 RepID=UPI00061D3813|nr:hypothetical protein [Hafnia alvei]KKF38681.1 hypothetical protein PU01_22075 [Hafnia alvei]MBW3477537.1 hypothetical protein [Hafnia alvei]TBM18249.1 hypothetical protein EYY83_04635 [Hafnia alvei]STQ69080.1 Uncharacterised protein [Hafnia alvei]